MEKLEIPAVQHDIVAAHQLFQRKPAHSGAAPRSITATFLTWDTRQRVLRAAWAKKVIRYEESRIFFDQDYSSKIQKERSLYAPIRKELQEKGVKSHIIYPSKLKVFGNEGAQTYSSAREAAAARHGQRSSTPTRRPGSQATSRRHTIAASFGERGRQREKLKTAEDLLKEMRGNLFEP